MELSDVLDEIQGEKNPQFPVEPSHPEDPQPSVLQEDTTEPGIEKETIDALEQFKLFEVYNKAVTQQRTLDKALAVEIFTMLPHSGDVSSIAKLTTAASVHNRRLLSQHLENYKPSPETLQPMFIQVQTAISQSLDDIEELRQRSGAYLEQVEQEVARIRGQARIVFCKRQIDLFTTPIYEEMKVDDRLIDFPPYAGVLAQAFQDIYSSYGFSQMFANTAFDTVTLEQVLSCLRNDAMLLQENEARLNEVNKNIFIPEFADRLTAVDFRDLLTVVDSVNRMKKLYCKDTDCLDAVLKLLKTLV